MPTPPPTPLPTLPPPPRRVRLLPNTNSRLRTARLIFIPHLLIGLASLVYSLFLFLAALYATQIPAALVSTYTEENRGHTNYNFRFTYSVHGQQITTHEAITHPTYSRFNTLLEQNPPAAQITIYYFSLGPLTHASMDDAWSPLLPVALWTLVWNLSIIAFLRQFILLPLRRRWLCQHGLPTPGNILSKTAARKLTYVTYSYQDSSGQPYKKKMLVPRLEDWQSVTPGDTRTVLHHPTKPHLSTLYELSGYEILPGAPTIKDDSPNPYAAS